MAVQRDRPYAQFNFLVDLGTGETDGPQAGFQECSEIGMSVDVIEYRNGNDKENSVRKLTGLARYPDVTLKRGIIGSLDLYQWLNEIRNGSETAYRTVTVQLMNEDHTSVAQDVEAPACAHRQARERPVQRARQRRRDRRAHARVRAARARVASTRYAIRIASTSRPPAGSAPSGSPRARNRTVRTADRRLVPREDVQLDLPHTAPSRPLDGRFQQRPPHALRRASFATISPRSATCALAGCASRATDSRPTIAPSPALRRTPQRADTGAPL